MKDGDALKELYALQLQKNTGQTIDGKKSNSLKLEFNPIFCISFISIFGQFYLAFSSWQKMIK